MTKETMQVQYKEIEKELEHLTEVSMKLRIFIQSQDFRDLSDLEATLAVAQHHQLEAYARVLTMRAALLGGRLQDPDGERTSVNDETPNKVITPPAPEVVTGKSVKVGDTLISEG